MSRWPRPFLLEPLGLGTEAILQSVMSCHAGFGKFSHPPDYYHVPYRPYYTVLLKQPSLPCQKIYYRSQLGIIAHLDRVPLV